MKDEILGAVDAFIENESPHDDMTLVVVKWLGLTA